MLFDMERAYEFWNISTIIRDIEKRIADFSFIPVHVVSASFLSISLLVYLVDTSGINDAF